MYKLPVTSPESQQLRDGIQRSCIDFGLARISTQYNSLMLRAHQNIAMAMLHLGCPLAALSNALLAIRSVPPNEVPRLVPKALHRAGLACASLHMPQAALFFLTQVR